MLAETSTSAIAYFYVFSMSSVIALASAIFMAVNAYLNKNLEQKTASFYSEKAMRMSHTLKSSKNLTAEFTTIGTASLKMWQSRFLHNLPSGRVLNIWWLASGEAIPFFTLTSLPIP